MTLNPERKGLWKAHLFDNQFPFIYNLRPINDHLKNYIYLSDIDLKKETISTSKGSFSDLSIIIKSKVRAKLFGKKNVFPFSMVPMPHIDSNTPSNIY